MELQACFSEAFRFSESLDFCKLIYICIFHILRLQSKSSDIEFSSYATVNLINFIFDDLYRVASLWPIGYGP
jgi:hypothetical protein